MLLIAFAPKTIWNHEYLYVALYMALIPDILNDIFLFIISLFRKKKINEKKHFLIVSVFTLVFFVYSVLNMQMISGKYHEIRSSKLKNEYTLVFFADLHYGSSQSKDTVDKALDEIGSLKPDMLVLGGDITDENTTREEMEYLYKKISSLDIPTYFVYGNHDRQERGDLIGGQKYTEKQLEEAITGNDIKILYEDYVKINDDLIIMGREDPSHPLDRKEVKDLPKTDKDSYFIVIDHTPYQNEDIIELKADLQLSGHTHAGQIFPVQTIYRIIGLNTCGDYKVGDTHLYISPGIAGWYFPLRSEAHSNYEVFELKPEQ